MSNVFLSPNLKVRPEGSYIEHTTFISIKINKCCMLDFQLTDTSTENKVSQIMKDNSSPSFYVFLSFHDIDILLTYPVCVCFQDKLKPNLAKMFSIMHKSVSEFSKKMLLEMKRHNYVTPTNYLELVSGYKK